VECRFARATISARRERYDNGRRVRRPIAKSDPVGDGPGALSTVRFRIGGAGGAGDAGTVGRGYDGRRADEPGEPDGVLREAVRARRATAEDHVWNLYWPGSAPVREWIGRSCPARPASRGARPTASVDPTSVRDEVVLRRVRRTAAPLACGDDCPDCSAIAARCEPLLKPCDQRLHRLRSPRLGARFGWTIRGRIRTAFSQFRAQTWS